MKRVVNRRSIEREFYTFLKDIEDNLKSEKITPKELEEILRHKGMDLFEGLVQDEARDILWENRDRILTVEVHSEDPWIPWEILRPFKGSKEDNYFCEKYEFSRWLAGYSFQNSSEKIDNVQLVMPKDTNLYGPFAELNWLKDLAEKARFYLSTCSDYKDVNYAIRNGQFNILHFATHGSYNETNSLMSTLMLEDNSKLTPKMVSELVNARLRFAPIVFLHACQTGVVGIGRQEKNPDFSLSGQTRDV